MDSGALLVFLLQEEESHAAYFLRKQGVERLALLRHLSHGTGSRADRAWHVRTPTTARRAIPLEAYATDLVAKAARGFIDPLVGREHELERVVQVLCRRRKNNPLLVGEPGVGKTALAEGLALRIHEGNVPDPLKGAKVFSLDLGAVHRRHALPRRLRGAASSRCSTALDREDERRSCSSTRSTRSSAPARRQAARWMPATC